MLGVIRPTVEKVGEISRNGNIGIVGTPGTIRSGSYELEIAKLHPTFHTYTQACPMWVPLVENREASSPGADYFVKQEVDRLMAKEPPSTLSYSVAPTIRCSTTRYAVMCPKAHVCFRKARLLPKAS